VAAPDALAGGGGRRVSAQAVDDEPVPPAQDLLAGYVDARELRDGIGDYVVPSALGDRPLGAPELARTARGR
jgi:hypothetical protein